ncbi:hypothetical protein BMS3Abin14_02041 [bacterium BMS3Abin14]|nr:hypothetical protein BMS3Abin14_02041 [bacterium BMS3Abin14]
MKRFSVMLLALVVIAAMAVPAMAADNLSLSGQMRVRAWALQAPAYNSTTNTWSPAAYDNTFLDQRLRIGGKFAVAEGVSITFRTDVTEATWGANGGAGKYGAGRLPASNGNQWDRAHLDLTSGDFHLRAGQQFAGFGIEGGTVNSQSNGFRVDMKGAVSFSGFFLLEPGKVDDGYLTAFQVGNKDYKVFAVNQRAVADVDESVTLVGANGKTSFGAINVKGELDFFTGDANATTDATGTQLFVDGSMAVGDAATVGGQLFYAAAAGTGESQYVGLGNDFGGWDPLVDVGTSLSNEKLKVGRPFDFTGDGAGVIGLRLSYNVKSSDAVNYAASLAYLTPEDDTVTTTDNTMLVAVGTTYKVMANTSLQAQVQYLSTSLDSGTDPEATLDFGFGLFVNF